MVSVSPWRTPRGGWGVPQTPSQTGTPADPRVSSPCDRNGTPNTRWRSYPAPLTPLSSHVSPRRLPDKYGLDALDWSRERLSHSSVDTHGSSSHGNETPCWFPRPTHWRGRDEVGSEGRVYPRCEHGRSAGRLHHRSADGRTNAAISTPSWFFEAQAIPTRRRFQNDSIGTQTLGAQGLHAGRRDGQPIHHGIKPRFLFKIGPKGSTPTPSNRTSDSQYFKSSSLKLNT